jgi:hypothetical protein
MRYDRSGKKINNLLENSRGLNYLAQKFAILDELNLILNKFLPPHLAPHCHIGAIDTEKNLVILYIDEPSIGHIIYSMVNPILEFFNQHHFSFAGVLTRLRQQTQNNSTQNPNNADEKFKDKLHQLATGINKPGLVRDAVVLDDDKEIDF